MSDKDNNLQVRLSSSERASFDEAAQAAGVTLSAWVRERLRRAAREELQSVGIKVAFIEALKVDHE